MNSSGTRLILVVLLTSVTLPGGVQEPQPVGELIRSPEKPAPPPELVLQTGFSNNLRQVAFALDGKNFLTNSFDGVVRVWDTATGSELLHVQPESGEIRMAAFSPDGKLLLTAESNGTVRCRDAITGKEVRRYFGAEADSAVFSPDGKWVLAGNLHGPTHLYDAVTAANVRTFPESQGKAGGDAGP